MRLSAVALVRVSARARFFLLQHSSFPQCQRSTTTNLRSQHASSAATPITTGRSTQAADTQQGERAMVSLPLAQTLGGRPRQTYGSVIYYVGPGARLGNTLEAAITEANDPCARRRATGSANPHTIRLPLYCNGHNIEESTASLASATPGTGVAHKLRENGVLSHS